MLRKLIALLFLCFAVSAANAQLIATDYGNCTMGVKDKAGNWIIQPRYDYLRETECGYIAMSASKSGLLNLRGDTLLPFVYDNIAEIYAFTFYLMPKCYYQVTLNQQLGVVDTSNKVIVPIRYQMIEAYRDTVFAAGSSSRHWYFYHTDGSMFRAPWKSRHRPAYAGRHRYVMEATYVTGRRCGLTDDSGHVVLKRKYSHINGTIYNSALVVSKHNKYGFCSLAGNFVWPMKFTYESAWSYWDNKYNYVNTLGIGPARKDGKWGLITIKGEEVLPFIYDTIQLFSQSHTGSEYLWIVSKDHLKGLYTYGKGWLIPAECTFIESVKQYFTRVDSAAVGVLVYKRNEYWGAMTSAGQEILPARYDEAFSVNSEDFVFRKQDSLIQLSVCEESNSMRLMEQMLDTSRTRYYSSYAQFSDVTQDKLFRVFHGRCGVTSFYNPAHTHDGVYFDGRYHKVTHPGKYYNFTVPDTIITACAFFTRPVQTICISSASVKGFYLEQLDSSRSSYPATDPDIFYIPSKRAAKLTSNYERYDRPGADYMITNSNDVITEDGKLIVNGDSIKTIESQQHATDGSFFFVISKDGRERGLDSLGRYQTPWINGDLEDFNSQYCWIERDNDYWNWVLFDRATGRMVTPAITTRAPGPLWDSVVIVETNKEGSRLLDLNCKKFITAGLNNILPLNQNGTAFAVKTCAGKMGIISNKGEWLADTVWNSLTGVDFERTIYFNYYDGEEEAHIEYYRYYILYNGQDKIIFDSHTKQFVAQQDVSSAWWKDVCVPVHAPSISRWVADSLLDLYFLYAPVFYCVDSDTSHFRNWHRACVLDTLYTAQRLMNAEDWLYRQRVVSEYGEYNVNYQCRFCYDLGFHTSEYEWTRPACSPMNYAPSLITDSVLSFSVCSRQFVNIEEYEINRTWFTNVLLFPAGPRNMLIDSLFRPDTDWRNFLINTTLNYVNSHTGISGDCHNPVAIPLLLSTSFQFTPDGIMLYPPGFTENSAQLKILLTPAMCDPYLRADIKSKLPGH